MQTNAETKPQSLSKDNFLAHWSEIPLAQPLEWESVPYEHTGSTYGECGIRITGTRGFIDSVLSRLKDTLALEEPVGGDTRLQTVYKESVDRETREPTGTWNCYIQVHDRSTANR
jgi:hypothetical protein